MTLDISLQHHGAAASSVAQAVVWIPSSDSGDSSSLAYASHAVVNLATATVVTLANGTTAPVWKVTTTLRTSLFEGQESFIITALAYAGSDRYHHHHGLVAGFSNGSLSVWMRDKEDGTDAGEWTELVLENFTNDNSRSITTISCAWIDNDRLGIVAGSSEGATFYMCSSTLAKNENRCVVQSSQPLVTTAIKSVSIRRHSLLGVMVLLGTAAPRHNRIHVYCGRVEDEDAAIDLPYAGGLTGHEDWITCLDWGPSDILATGSQDSRIRLWRFTTTKQDVGDATEVQSASEFQPEEYENDSESDSDEDKQAAEEEEEGEARLEFVQGQYICRVTLEALLLGHEEMVTGVSWHPSPLATYGEELLLISSSMDRSILLWTCALDDGIWAPLTRVGNAGGILGGSVGSSLLGYLSASIDPCTGNTLVGHAFGGAIHTWRLDDTELREQLASNDGSSLSTEDRASLVHWRAKSCVTGHFGSVADLSWEASRGSYLLSVGRDQTCRLWTTVDNVWLELGRPQVHGYDLASVVSLSTPDHPHLLVTGADEKEIRAFDAPRATLELLQQAAGITPWPDDAVQRVERAYIPSLGLSNKATASEAAEEETPNEDDLAEVSRENGHKNGNLCLPMERDLGAVSLWPEIRKLFGHNTELYCLTSTLTARTAPEFATEKSSQILVASACKARDVESAALRLWNVHQGTCHQVLSGGHKATVATMAFSPCGTYLASSGKDRRLCLWKKDSKTNQFQLAWAKESAHKRIIWSVHFCPWDPKCLVSGSRDGCLKIWQIQQDSDATGTVARAFSSFSPSFALNGKPDAVTALSLRPTPLKDGMALLAVGLESGRLEFWSIPTRDSLDIKPSLLCAAPLSVCHRAAISKLAWQPQRDGDDGVSIFLASSSLDHGVRIFKVKS